jgi:hypothetical protein
MNGWQGKGPGPHCAYWNLAYLSLFFDSLHISVDELGLLLAVFGCWEAVLIILSLLVYHALVLAKITNNDDAQYVTTTPDTIKAQLSDQWTQTISSAIMHKPGLFVILWLLVTLCLFTRHWPFGRLGLIGLGIL